MQERAVRHETISQLVSSLKQCSKTGDVEKGKHLHRDATVANLDTDKYVVGTLITMYSKCHEMEMARGVFDKVMKRDVVIWTSLILGYAENGENIKALKLLEVMDCEPDSFTYVAALKACGGLATEPGSDKQSCLCKGIELHKRVKAQRMDSLVIVANTLIDMYSKCGSVQRAKEVFDIMKRRDTVTWNCLILGYLENGERFRAWSSFTCMDCEPTSVTYVAALKICSELASANEYEKVLSLEKGIRLHKEVRNRGLESDILVATTLLDMYCKCGSMQRARAVFDGMTRRDVVAWNSLILGYVGNAESSVALGLFTCMDCAPDSFTYVAALKACGDLASKKENEKQTLLEKGIDLHRQVKARQLDSHNVVTNTLIDMYSKCGSMEKAKHAFDTMTQPDVVSWNSLISGYVANEQPGVAVDLFLGMDCKPCLVTYIGALKACAALTLLATGRDVHVEVCKLGLEHDDLLSTALMDFYTKCGCMDKAQALFHAMHTVDMVSWTTLISGYSAVGDSSRVVHLAKEMHEAGVEMDGVALTCVLAACSHQGLVEKGKRYFESTTVSWTAEHYNCMVDLLGRANRLEEALALVKAMPLKADDVTWMTLLGACNKWKNVEVGKAAFDALVAGGAHKAAAYVLMSDIYGNS